ncbi:MAG: glycosyltransferase [Terrimicrobiaceae bacterium]|nr:glycosyltransferase [Terrimicrobiaceae bacterium]
MLLSIITPSFRQLDWLRVCIASVRDQVGSGVQVEHIVQDAGSEGIAEFAREHGGALVRDGTAVEAPADGMDYRLVIYSERDGGMYDAINRGFARARGEVVAYLNCDEQYLPGALKAVKARFEADPAFEMLFADAVVVREDGSFLCFRKAQVPFRDQLWFRMPVLSCATFLRRSAFVDKGVRVDETKNILGDVIWIMRAQEARLKMGVLRRFTSIFTETDGNLGVGGAADREFLDLRRRMPAHVRSFLPAYEFYHKVRSLLAGTRSHPAFDYQIFTKQSPVKRQCIHVAHPTAVWKGRTETDKNVLSQTEQA